eukprot:g1809.t1
MDRNLTRIGSAKAGFPGSLPESKSKKKKKKKDKTKKSKKRKLSDPSTVKDGDKRTSGVTASSSSGVSSLTSNDKKKPLLVPLSSIRYRNKQRTLIFSSRGTNAQCRHLMRDLCSLMPHHKKEAKLDVHRNISVINEIAEMKSCANTLFFEVRKKKDVFLWVAKTPTGPSAKFHIENVHTMDELKLLGNCLAGSRPLLSFNPSFDDPRKPELRLLRELFTQVFGTPLGHPKSKPFVDHVLNFSYADNRIWIRNYQIIEQTHDVKKVLKDVKQGKKATTDLQEIGPRLTLHLARIFRGSFGGQTLFVNPFFASPNMKRIFSAHDAGKKTRDNMASKRRRVERQLQSIIPEDAISQTFME